LFSDKLILTYEASVYRVKADFSNFLNKER
jgi:hypothetical protein